MNKTYSKVTLTSEFHHHKYHIQIVNIWNSRTFFMAKKSIIVEQGMVVFCFCFLENVQIESSVFWLWKKDVTTVLWFSIRRKNGILVPRSNLQFRVVRIQFSAFSIVGLWDWNFEKPKGLIEIKGVTKYLTSRRGQSTIV